MGHGHDTYEETCPTSSLLVDAVRRGQFDSKSGSSVEFYLLEERE